MRVGLVYDDLFTQHVSMLPHPESPERLLAVKARLDQEGLIQKTERLPLRLATDDELLLVHTSEHLKALEVTTARAHGQIDPDTFTCAKSYDIARKAAGTAVAGVEALLDDHFDTVVALVRPPGHHATAEQAMGFCLLNNAAIVANKARHHLGLKRVAIVDWDVHHGNGTEAIFYRDPSVLYVSSHQHPFYPGTGEAADIGQGEGQGFNLNFPVPAGLSEASLLSLYQNIILPTLRQFEPELLVISAGYDSHVDDPLGELKMTPTGFNRITAWFEDLRHEFKGLKTIYLLEGGYNTAALAACVAALIQGLKEGFVASGAAAKTSFSFGSGERALLKNHPLSIQQKWQWPL